MMKISKAIIPVAGWGTRRLPITKIIEKSMLPVGNRPLVDYSVQELVKAGVKDIYMIVSNVEPCQVRAYYRDNLALNIYLKERGKEDRLEKAKTIADDVKIHYITQDPSGKYGTAIPIALAVEEYGLNEPVLYYMGDDFIWNPGGPSATDLLTGAVENEDESAIYGLQLSDEETARFAALSADDDGFLTEIVEKPPVEEAHGKLASVGKYVLSPELLKEVTKYVHEHDFGPDDQEYMITDPIETYIKNGGKMRLVKGEGEQLDGGTLEGWIHANNVVAGA